jgi:Holliday junction resolvase RusA-like endonuclease
MSTYSFTIPGSPVSKARPRVCKWGTYTPIKTVNYETLVKELFIMEHFGKMLEGQIAMTVTAYFGIPKSGSKKLKADMLSGTARPTKKPDVDNLIKIIADALNGLAYNDDSQIVLAIVEKWYSDIPRVEITIEEVGV